MSAQAVASVRDRIVPMLEYVAQEYDTRVPPGYPVIVDQPEHAVVGIELDVAHALYIVSDGTNTFADFYYRSTRWDTRSSASREKFGGAPLQDRRPLPPDVSDRALRNLIAELLHRFNYEQNIIHMTDT